MKSIFRMMRAELVKQCTQGRFVVLLAAVLLFSALFPIVVGNGLLKQTEQEFYLNQSYDDFLTSIDLYRTTGFTESKKRIVEFSREMAAKKKQSLAGGTWSIEFKDSFLSPSMLFDLEYTDGVYQINNGELTESELTNFVEQIPNWNIQFRSKDDRLGAQGYKELVEAEEILEAGIGFEEIARRNIDFLVDKVTTISEANEKGDVGNDVYGADVGAFLEYYQKRLEFARQEYSHNAYDPTEWRYLLFHSKVKDSLSLIESYNSTGWTSESTIYRPEKDLFYTNLQDLTDKERAGVLRKVTADLSKAPDQAYFALINNMKPMEFAQNARQTRMQLLSFLPFLLIVGAAAAIFAACSIAREYKRKTISVIMAVPVSKKKMVVSLFCAAGVAATLLVLAAVLCNIIVCCILFGANDALQSDVFLFFGRPFGIWFPLYYIWRVFQLLCVVWLTVAAAFAASLTVRRAFLGVGVGIVLPTLLLAYAAYPQIDMQRRYAAFLNRLDVIDSAIHWDLQGVINSVVKHLELGLWIMPILILTIVFVYVSIKRFEYQQIDKLE